jgi:CBS domain-containing protein
MRPVDKIHFLNPDLPAVEALEIMGREDVHQLPVMSNGRVQGIVTRAHILEILQSRSELSGVSDLPRAA